MTRGSRDNAGAPQSRELHLDRLLGRQVLARNAKPIGRLEEVRAEARGSGLIVTGYVIGPAALLERLGIGLRLLFGRKPRSYVAGPDQLDISDPQKPRLTCPPDKLQRV